MVRDALRIAVAASLVMLASAAEAASLKFAGGDGSSQDNAVVITGASGELEGVMAEHAWAEHKHPTWRWSQQALVHTSGRAYDVIDLQSADGAHEVWFDITDFLGK